MTTTTSFSERGRFLPLYRFTLRQNAGYFGLASLLIFLFYPLQYLMEIFKKVPPDFFSGWDPAIPLDPYEPYSLYGLGRNFTDVSMVLFTMVFLLLPFVLALMLNTYMHSKKAADVYHALPIRREMLMAVNAAVAMTIVAAPFLVSTVVVAVASAVKFGAAAPLGFLLLDVAGWLACAFLIYAVTALICTQVGTVFDTFLFSGVFFFLLPILVWTTALLGSLFLYGFDVPDGLLRLALWLSPVLYPIERMQYNFDAYRFGTGAGQAELGAFNTYFPASNVVMVIYFILGAVLLLLAMRLYTRRHSERAETTTSKGAVATTVQFAGTLLGGILGGMLFYAIGDQWSKLVYLFWCVISGLVMFAVLEVILNRGFKTLLRRAPLGGIMVAVTTGLSVLMMTGGLGYEKRVPDPEATESVSTHWAGSYNEMGYHRMRNRREDQVELSSPEAIKILTDFHNAAANEQFERYEDELVAQGKHSANAYIDLKYEKPGLPMVRRYNQMSTETLSKLIPLELSEEYQKQVNPFFLLDPSQVDSWTVSDALGWDEKVVRLSPADNQRLLEAIRADYLTQDPESVLHPQDKVVAHLTASYAVRDLEYAFSTGTIGAMAASDRQGGSDAIYTAVSGPETVKVLRELNLLPDAPDISQCVGAYVQPARSYYINEGQPQWYIHQSMIMRINNSEYGGEERYYSRKESSRTEFENETYLKELHDAGYRETFLEDPEKLALLAENLAPSWKADEPAIQVTFFGRERDSNARTVLVPLSRLPVSLQEELDPIAPAAE